MLPAAGPAGPTSSYVKYESSGFVQRAGTRTARPPSKFAALKVHTSGAVTPALTVGVVDGWVVAAAPRFSFAEAVLSPTAAVITIAASPTSRRLPFRRRSVRCRNTRGG